MKRFAIGLMAGATAYATHPFVGENPDEPRVMREDGTLAVAIKPTPTTHDKYATTIRDRTINSEKPQSFLDQFKQQVFGKSHKQKAWDRKLTKYRGEQRSK